MGCVHGLAVDALGIGDNCNIMPRNMWQDDPVMGFIPVGEECLIYLRSRAETHIWTNKAYYLIKGAGSHALKRMTMRYSYGSSIFTDVQFETAGRSFTDLDCELKYKINGEQYSVDIMKNQVEEAKRVYVAIVNLASEQHRIKTVVDMIKMDFNPIGEELFLEPGKEAEQMPAINAEVMKFSEKFRPNIGDVIEKTLDGDPSVNRSRNRVFEDASDHGDDGGGDD